MAAPRRSRSLDSHAVHHSAETVKPRALSTSRFAQNHDASTSETALEVGACSASLDTPSNHTSSRVLTNGHEAAQPTACSSENRGQKHNLNRSECTSKETAEPEEVPGLQLRGPQEDFQPHASARTIRPSSPELEILGVRKVRRSAAERSDTKSKSTSNVISSDNSTEKSLQSRQQPPRLSTTENTSLNHLKKPEDGSVRPVTNSGKLSDNVESIVSQHTTNDRGCLSLHSDSAAAHSVDTHQVQIVPRDGAQASHTMNWHKSGWTTSQYVSLADMCVKSFPVEHFAHVHGKSCSEVRDVFQAIIMMPLLTQSGQSPSKFKSGMGERRTEAYIKLRDLIEEDHRKERALVFEKLEQEVREEIEMQIWARMRQEGWVKIEQARTMLDGKDVQKQDEPGFQSGSASSASARKVNRAKGFDEALKDLLDATTELNKAKKAEDRKSKAKKPGKKDFASDDHGSGKSGFKRKRDEI